MHRGYAGFGNNVTDRHQFGAHPEDLDVIGVNGISFSTGLLEHLWNQIMFGGSNDFEA